jgi:decaprenyl-phosphate phosphoribosyltransferase
MSYDSPTSMLLKLMRVKQWYKNLLIFLPIFFAAQVFNIDALSKVVLGFISLCLISSAYYILNDLYDAKEDQKHPAKKDRLIASGKVSTCASLTLSAALFTIAITLAYIIKPGLILFPLALFTATMWYTVYFRNIPIIDMYFIGFNFMVRTLAGAYIISTFLSAWTILLVFIIAIFLTTGKRKYDLETLPSKVKYKKIYKIYNKEFLHSLQLVLAASLFFIYVLYSFLAHDNPLMIGTSIFVSYIIFRYLYLSSINHPIIGKNELFFKDISMVLAFALWAISCFVILYFL